MTLYDIEPDEATIAARLRDAFRYEPDTGRLIRRRTGREVAGPYRIKGLNNKRIFTNFEGERLVATRVIWAIHTGQWPPPHLIVAHKNNDPCDTRIDNLHLISRDKRAVSHNYMQELQEFYKQAVIQHLAKRSQP